MLDQMLMIQCKNMITLFLMTQKGDQVDNILLEAYICTFRKTDMQFANHALC